VLDLARDPHLGQEKPTATHEQLAAPARKLDLATALKVSEEISGEIVLERLIDKVLRTASSTRVPSEAVNCSRGDELRIEAKR